MVGAGATHRRVGCLPVRAATIREHELLASAAKAAHAARFNMQAQLQPLLDELKLS